MRAYAPIFAIVLPILLGLGLIYLFTQGTIGVATALAGAFALVAFAVTVVVFHGGDEPESDGFDSRMRL